MSETGQTWQRSFKGLPIEASDVRAWTSTRATHPDAPAVAHELFIAVLATGTDAVEMTLSTSGERLRITATGTALLSARHSHGPGWRIIAGLSRMSGLTTDERGLWAQMEFKQ